MDQLRNLEELYAAVTQNFTQYDGTEFILPNSFREQVKEIDNSILLSIDQFFYLFSLLV